MREQPEDRAASDRSASEAAGDRDQSLADRDELASQSDRRSADDDQDASDDDLMAGGDAVAHRHSRMTRERTSRSRDRTSALRDESAVERFTPAVPPPQHGGATSASLDEVSLRGVRNRSRAAADRAKAADDRARHRNLRVLVADEGRDRLEHLGEVVSGLGHEVVARVVEVKDVGVITTREHPDVALVWLGDSSDHALELIDEIVHEASCPVIALLTVQDSAYVREAARRGIFAYIVETGPEELQSAIDITLQRFAQYHDLQGAFGRRAVIEQAKGMLMARHGIDGDRAFELLRKHSQHGGRRLSDVAAAIVEANALLPPESRNMMGPARPDVESAPAARRSRR
jgi:AmiR/NasT family two-component response regulator